jgi:cytochrome P450
MTIDEYAVRKGQLILISPYAMQRRPDYYPDPERFDPDRFSPQQEQARPDYSFLPFNAGPHGCVGNHLALMTLHLVLATLLQHVGFAPASGRPIVPQAASVLRPAEGSRVVVRRRR